MKKTEAGSDFPETGDESRGFSRRDFLKAAAGLAGMPLAGTAFGAPPSPFVAQKRMIVPGCVATMAQP